MPGVVWLPKCASMRSRPRWAEPEICFRVVHAAKDGHKGGPVAAYREQPVEIAALSCSMSALPSRTASGPPPSAILWMGPAALDVEERRRPGCSALDNGARNP